MLESKSPRSVKVSQTAHLPLHHQNQDVKLSSILLESEKFHAISSDVLRWQKMKIYRERIAKMRPEEITQAHAEGQNQPVWQESLEICGATRLRHLVESGDTAAVAASQQLDRQIQEKQGN